MPSLLLLSNVVASVLNSVLTPVWSPSNLIHIRDDQEADIFFDGSILAHNGENISWKKRWKSLWKPNKKNPSLDESTLPLRTARRTRTFTFPFGSRKTLASSVKSDSSDREYTRTRCFSDPDKVKLIQTRALPLPPVLTTEPRIASIDSSSTSPQAGSTHPEPLYLCMNGVVTPENEYVEMHSPTKKEPTYANISNNDNEPIYMSINDIPEALKKGNREKDNAAVVQERYCSFPNGRRLTRGSTVRKPIYFFRKRPIKSLS